MKLRNIYIGLAAVGTLAAASCSEDATLSGAKEVYITIDPASYSLCVGDTVKVSAYVKNLSGNIIDTPIQWTSDDPEKVSVVEFRDTVFVLGDTVFSDESHSNWYIPREVKSIGDQLYIGITARAGSQGTVTKLRALLSDGKYAIAPVTVTNHTATADGITAISSNVRTYRATNFEQVDTAWFAVNPWGLIDDFTPKASLRKLDAAPSELTLAENPIVIDRQGKRVGVLLVPDRSYGEFSVTLTVSDASASVPVTVGPPITVGMWDPDPLLGMTYAPTGNMSYGFFYEVRKTVNVNSDVEVYARLMVPSGWQEDIDNAHNSYHWEMAEGSSLRIIKSEERPNEYGFDCVLTLRSNTTTGENVINFCSPDTVAPTMTAYITVTDYERDYPVNDVIITPKAEGMTLDNLWAVAGENLELDVTLDPVTSLGIWRPQVEVADPSIITLQNYTGTLMALKALAPGTTTIKISSHGIVKELPVTVYDNVIELNWTAAADRMILGQSSEFAISVRTTSGMPSTMPVTWKSSNESIFTVSGNGESATVTAKAAGTATLTATVTTGFGAT
ncbi:MAG: Ig-like domain-containing protein, partial [Muribaculaceae bacterium]|nr:Ig-like domain-containing protein [Muribaculaceae bacterium]